MSQTSHAHRAIHHFYRMTVLGMMLSITSLASANVGDYIAQLTRSDTEDDNFFGSAVAVQGTVAVVGSSTPDFHVAPGSVYVYDFSDPQHIEELQLFSPTAQEGVLEKFGFGVAISGSYVFVGAPNVSSSTGIVHMYDISDPLNITHQSIHAFDAQPLNQFGYSLAADGNRLVVGAPNFSGIHSTLPSAAYIIDFTDPDNLQQSKLTLDPSDSGQFGLSVDIEGNYLIVNESNTDIGAAHLYDLSDSNNIRSKTLLPSDSNPQLTSEFATNVAVSGTKALVSASGDLGPVNNPGSHSGTVYLYDFSDWNNVTETEFTAADTMGGDTFGASSGIDLQGNIAVIGAKNSEDGTLFSQGATYAFDVSDPQHIIELSKFVPPDTAAGDRFGTNLAFDGQTVVVTSQRNSTNGAAYLFDVPEPATTLLLLPAMALVLRRSIY